MSQDKRGILYIVWGEKIEPQLQRSIESVHRFYPEMPIHIERGTAGEGLMQKSRMGSLTPFESTVYLDADTVVLGNLDYAFEKSEQTGLACTINECPWLNRYGAHHGDATEYNTGVLFFTPAARPVFDAWQQLAPMTPSRSVWLNPRGEKRGMDYDDQASFGVAVKSTGWNPSVLPLNWNFRPEYYRRAFMPIKIWHDYRQPPANLVALIRAGDGESQATQLVDFNVT